MRSCLRAAFLAAMCGVAVSGFSLTVTPSSDVSVLLANALGSSPGVTFQSATYTGAVGSAGAYSGLTFAPLSGLSQGVLLTTGDAQLAVGPNNDDGAGYGNGGPTGTFNNYDGTNSIDMNDVATLTINFNVQSATSLSFDFSFGSEEYYYYTNSGYNDAFLAFLDGGSKTLALDSQGNAITINNQFLTIDNRPDTFDPTNGYGLPDKQGTGTADGINELQYDGFTPVLRTSFDVAPGDHTLTFVIGDAGDTVFDSGVFISNIFGPGKSGGGTDPVPEPATISFLAIGLGGFLVRRKRGKTAP